MMETNCELAHRKCRPCEGGVPPLSRHEAEALAGSLDEWTLLEGSIEKTFGFENFYETMAFVNAVAWIAHGEDHHPDMEVGYRTCLVRYSTHAIEGLSENDFICAAKVDAIRAP